jgi:hypothetical protein
VHTSSSIITASNTAEGEKTTVGLRGFPRGGGSSSINTGSDDPSHAGGLSSAVRASAHERPRIALASFTTAQQQHACGAERRRPNGPAAAAAARRSLNILCIEGLRRQQRATISTAERADKRRRRLATDAYQTIQIHQQNIQLPNDSKEKQ